jgi:hypothetical protein
MRATHKLHVFAYFRTFHRLHLLRLWTPTLLYVKKLTQKCHLSVMQVVDAMKCYYATLSYFFTQKCSATTLLCHFLRKNVIFLSHMHSQNYILTPPRSSATFEQYWQIRIRSTIICAFMSADCQSRHTGTFILICQF